MYCRMLQGEHSAIFLTFINLLFVIKTFDLSILERFYCTVPFKPGTIRIAPKTSFAVSWLKYIANQSFLFIIMLSKII